MINWWNVGEPADVVAWCEKNVEGACKQLAEDCLIFVEPIGNDFSLKIHSGLMETYIGEQTTIKTAVDDYLKDYIDGFNGPHHHMFPEHVVASLRSLREYMDSILEKYDAR